MRGRDGGGTHDRARRGDDARLAIRQLGRRRGNGGLIVIVAALGPALAHLPIDSLRLVVGTVLLIFGLQWLRKAILRASGLKALHDEDAIYAAEVAELRANGEQPTHDWYAFTVVFKGVFLEGLEVAFIIVTFGGTQHNVGLAAIGAAAAFVVVLVAGLIVHAPLSRVPENTLKFGVGIMLTSFGIFWAAEGAGIAWPGADVVAPGRHRVRRGRGRSASSRSHAGPRRRSPRDKVVGTVREVLVRLHHR